MNNNEKELMKEESKTQMKLNHFCELYDIPRASLMEWIHGFNFPAYKIGGRWYVDIKRYYDWRDRQHEKAYLYA